MPIEPDARMRVWIVGSGGMLGSALTHELRDSELFQSRPVRWSSPTASVSDVVGELDRFRDAVSSGDRWAIAWAAGSGVMASSQAHLDQEAAVFEAFVRHLAQRPPSGRGGFFLASSASVYAGSAGAPFDEFSAPRPLNSYGRTKLRQEDLARSILDGRVPVAVGRISTLYGPGQQLRKPQGLISQMCVQSALSRPISIYVPMDTLRDYLYVADAAALIRGTLTQLIDGQAPSTRILASERATTVGELVRVVRQVSRTRVGVAQRISTSSALHIKDLRLTSRVPLPGRGEPLPLPIGVKRIVDDILRRHRTGQFAGALDSMVA